MANKTKRGGFPSFLAFILGVVFGIILLVGAVVGLGWFALNYDLSNVEQNKNEDGTYKYIDADQVSTLLELFTTVRSMADNTEEMTLGEIESLLPFTTSFTDTFFDALDSYVELDRAEFKKTAFGQLGGYLQETVMTLNVAATLEKVGMTEILENEIAALILYGAEAEYAYSQEARYPLYYDEYVYDEESGAYLCGESTYDATVYADYAVATEVDGKTAYRLYFFADGDGNYLAKNGENGFETTAETYDPVQSAPSGNYYYETADSTDRIYLDPVTVRDLMEGDLLGALYDVPVLDLIEISDETMSGILDGVTVGEFINDPMGIFNKIEIDELLGENADETIREIFAGVTLGDILDGTFNFDDIDLSVLLKADPSNVLVSYLVYSIMDVTPLENGEVINGETATYTATYSVTDETGAKVDYTAYVVVGDDGKISSVYYNENEHTEGAEASYIQIPATTISDLMNADIQDLLGGLKILSLMTDVSEDDIVYKLLKDLTVGDLINGDFDKNFDTIVISELLGEDGDETLKNIFGDLTLADLISGEFELNIDVASLVDIDPTNRVMVYIAYGLTSVISNNDNGTITVDGTEIAYGYTARYSVTNAAGETIVYTAYVAVDVNESGEKYVSAVYYDEFGDGNYTLIPAASLDEISERVKNITYVLAIADLMYVKADNNIMMFLAFSVTDVEQTGADGQLTGKYHYTDADGNDVTIDCFINVDTDGYVTDVYYNDADEGKVSTDWTKISEISDQVSKLTDTLKIGDIITIDANSSAILRKLADCTISELDGEIKKLTIADVIDVDASSNIMVYLAYGVTGVTETDGAYSGKYEVGGTAYDVTIETDKNGIITKVYYTDNNGTETEVSATPIDQISSKIEGITDNLTIGDIITIDGNSSAILQKLKDKKIGELDTAINDLTVGDIITIDETSSALLQKLKDKKIGELDTAINDLTLADVMDVKASSNIMVYLAYGISGVKEETGAITVDGTDINYGYTAKYGVTDETGETVVYTAYVVVGEDGKISSVYYNENEHTEGAEASYIQIPATAINAISGQIDGLTATLTIGELIGEGNIDQTNKVLYALRNYTVSDLPTALATITVNELYADNIYGASSDGTDTAVLYFAKDSTNMGEATTYGDGNYIYYTKSDENVYALASTTGKLTEAEFNSLLTQDSNKLYTLGAENGVYYILFDAEYLYYAKNADGDFALVGSGDTLGRVTGLDGSTEYYTYGAANALWQLMLYTKDENGNSDQETAYNFNQLSSMISNVQANLQNATLRTLQEAGFIELSPEQLDTPKETLAGQCLGDMTIAQLLNTIANMN